MTHSGAAGANRPNLTFCSVADMSLKMERHRQRTQPFWKSPLHVLGIVICLGLGFTFLAYWSGQKASSNASNGAWSNHADFRSTTTPPGKRGIGSSLREIYQAATA